MIDAGALDEPGTEPDFSGLTFTISDSVFGCGSFITALITFLSVAAVIYFFVVVPMNKLNPPAAATTRDCPECTSEIANAAARCPHCTTQIPAASPERPGAAIEMNQTARLLSVGRAVSRSWSCPGCSLRS